MVADALVTADSLADLQATRKVAVALLARIDGRIDEGKHLVAERAEALVILAPKQFSVPRCGNVLLGRGQRVVRAKQPAHFAAIVAQLTHGEHFLFA